MRNGEQSGKHDEGVIMQIELSEIPPDFSKKVAVMRVIDRPLEDLTVDDICCRCGISRSKFYEMFKSKFDIGYWYLNLVYRLALGKIGRTLSWKEGIVASLELMDQERTYFRHTVGTPDNVPNLYWAVQGDRVASMEEILRERGIALTPELRVEMLLYAGNIDRMLRMWVNAEVDMSREQFADLWIDCIPDGLFAALSG